MPLDPSVVAAIARLNDKYNGNNYHATTNPGGMAADGHRVNFVPALRDVASVGAGVAEAAETVGSQADAVAIQSAQAAQDAEAAEGFASDAETSAGEAAAYAAGLNLPAVTIDDAGNALIVKLDGTGYETGPAVPADESVTLEKIAPAVYGVGPNRLLQLDADGKLPAVDASQVSGLAPVGLIPIGAPVAAAFDAAVDFILPGGYSEYIVKFWSVRPATDNVEFWLRTSTDGGANFDATGYRYSGPRSLDDAATVAANSSTGTSAYKIISGFNMGNLADEIASGQVQVFRPGDAAVCLITSSAVYGYSSSGQSGQNLISGRRDTAANVDALRFMFSSGNIAAGTFQLYGVATGS